MKPLRILAMCSIPIVSLAGVLTGCNETVSDISSTIDNPYTFSEAVAAIQTAPNLTISLRDLPAINLSASDQSMQKVQHYLKDSSLKSTLLKKRTTVENGVTRTSEVTIPYAYGYILTFGMEDGSEVWFNCSEDTVWFETEEAIYQSSFSSEFSSFLDELLEPSISS
jgi:hypothetical protein